MPDRFTLIRATTVSADFNPHGSLLGGIAEFGSRAANVIAKLVLAPLAIVSLTACGDAEGPTGSYGASEDASLVRNGPSERAVQIGFDGPRFDACASFARVTNLSADGEGLAVLAAPAGSAEVIDRIGAGRGVSMCQKVGDWVGVVYAPDADDPIDCGTGSPVPTRRAYDGPCRSGWVDEDFLKLVAG